MEQPIVMTYIGGYYLDLKHELPEFNMERAYRENAIPRMPISVWGGDGILIHRWNFTVNAELFEGAIVRMVGKDSQLSSYEIDRAKYSGQSLREAYRGILNTYNDEYLTDEEREKRREEQQEKRDHERMNGDYAEA